ncbi:MAG TPA: methyltransferase domain-containing protein [Terriglobales bacterium]|nr:methyltransferase domain-containing protein [Terriglobales bacterium]
MVARLRSSLLFARTFLKHPVMLGSVLPSSRYLTDHVLSQVDWKGVRTFVEYGPGVGTFTSEVLRRLSPDARLVAIEASREFALYLRQAFKDPRLTVVHGSAVEVSAILERLDLPAADCIISGIPYSTMPLDVREAVLRRSRDVLRPGGSFIVYQFTGAVVPHLRQVFGEVRQEFELLNILPARIFSCSR